MPVWTSKQRLAFRRARSEVDGPHSTFALMAGRRIPLSVEQVTWLNKEVVSLSELPSSRIRELISEMLNSDRFGTQPPMDIAGFMRTQSPYDGSLVERAANPPGSCDKYGRELAVGDFITDGCITEELIWSWMCGPCFFGLGCGVGTGWGQLYLKYKNGRMVLVLGA